MELTYPPTMQCSRAVYPVHQLRLPGELIQALAKCLLMIAMTPSWQDRSSCAFRFAVGKQVFGGPQPEGAASVRRCTNDEAHCISCRDQAQVLSLA